MKYLEVAALTLILIAFSYQHFTLQLWASKIQSLDDKLEAALANDWAIMKNLDKLGVADDLKHQHVVNGEKWPPDGYHLLDVRDYQVPVHP